MKNKHTVWVKIALVFLIPVLFIYLTITNSTDCSQLVIDTYELHSNIDIPSVDFINCYYDEQTDVRISVYQLKEHMDISQFEIAANSSILHGAFLLSEMEHPTSTVLYAASGEKWGTKWTYLIDNDTRMLWCELKY